MTIQRCCVKEKWVYPYEWSLCLNQRLKEKHDFSNRCEWIEEGKKKKSILRDAFPFVTLMRGVSSFLVEANFPIVTSFMRRARPVSLS